MRTSSETMPAGREAPAAAERTPETLAAGSERGGFYGRVFEADRARGFLSFRNGVAFALYLAFALTFASFRVSNDGLVYYDFLRRFFGEHIGNGGGYAASDLSSAQSEFAGLTEAAIACVEKLEELGVTVKDLDLGLLDFPARRDGLEVELCWHVGEDAVEFWHEIGEGYAGRKPIDWGE